MYRGISAMLVKDIETRSIVAFQQTFGISHVGARLLALRTGSDADRAARFLDPKLAHMSPPHGMADLEVAAERIARAAVVRETVGVFGDYDVDGVSSASIVADCVQSSGAIVQLRVASRDDGYGFTVKSATELVEGGCSLIVLTDCGTSDIDAVQYVSSNGVDVISVDHHRIPEGTWPGYALVNPQREECQFTNKTLCSAGIAFYLAAAVRREMQRLGHEGVDPRTYLDLAALGTLADVVPLVEENRILVARGLKLLSRTTRPGLRELLRLAAIRGPVPTADDVMWRIAPRINAPGRLGDATVALNCLFLRDAELARSNAIRCDELNEQRKKIQQRVVEEARQQVQAAGNRSFYVVSGNDWHPGVVGIVAARLVEETGRPVAVVAIEGERGRGSARSIPGIDLFALFSACSDKLTRFGGHAMAAGFALPAANISEFNDALDNVAAPLIEQSSTTGRSGLSVEAVVSLSEVSVPLCEEIERLGPFGEANPHPVLGVSSAIVDSARIVGADHLLLSLRQGDSVRSAIAFRMGARLDEARGSIDVAFVPEIDEFRGRQARLRIVDFEQASDAV